MNGYFYGWYFKCQSDTQTLAVIPAIHGAGRERTCSIQFITEEHTWTVEYPWRELYQREHTIRIGENRFERSGMHLRVETSQICVTGEVRFSMLTPLRYDIMGPFVFVPSMQCRHSVYSMRHRVDGHLCINGKDYVFENAVGYWEGDRGCSFPKEYAWTHSFLEEKDGVSQGSIMLSVADIPLAGCHFTGIIGIVHWDGKEYRFATYLGARVIQKSKNRLLVRQGNLELEVRLVEENAHPLQAPVNGVMSRTICENVKSKAFYRLRKKGQTMFAVESERASFEFEYR